MKNFFLQGNDENHFYFSFRHLTFIIHHRPIKQCKCAFILSTRKFYSAKKIAKFLNILINTIFLSKLSFETLISNLVFQH